VSASNGVEEVVDAQVVEEIPTVPNVGALVPTGGASLAVAPQVQPTELVERLEAIKQAQQTAMVQDVDYGVIPGTKSKPTLLKPGAEKLSVLFQLDIQLVNEKMWGPDDHLTVISRATVFHAPTGARMGGGEGICTTREKKYGKRKQDRACPACGETAIKKSKYPPRSNPQADPGWYCFAKVGGCGAEFAADDPKITSQPLGEIENPDLPDTWNTVVKMAAKRARVDAVLAVTGASALFTQDVEDDRPSTDQEPQRQEPPRPLLDDEKFGHLRDGIRALGLNYAEINHTLGAFGANGLMANTPEAVDAALRALHPDQAVKVMAHLEKVAQDREATAPQGGGEANA
jgi:hypothetical protein